jgi:hypothetical protein
MVIVRFYLDSLKELFELTTNRLETWNYSLYFVTLKLWQKKNQAFPKAHAILVLRK